MALTASVAVAAPAEAPPHLFGSEAPTGVSKANRTCNRGRREGHPPSARVQRLGIPSEQVRAFVPRQFPSLCRKAKG